MLLRLSAAVLAVRLTASFAAPCAVLFAAPLATLGAFAGVAAAPLPAAAQTAAQSPLESKAALRARQNALYVELQRRPDDVQLMAAYARVSAKLENYEAAIATLERLLIFAPNDARAKAELGALYFRVGSYQVAERYFRDAAAGGLTADRAARVQRYRAEIRRRTAKNRISGEVRLGAIASSNATLGPDVETVAAPGGGVLRAQADADGDVGARLKLSFRHDYDLGRPNADVWRTDFRLDGRRWSDADSLDFAGARLRTGPVLAIEPTIHGLKIRPFAEVVGFSADEELIYVAPGGGVALSKTFGDAWAAYGEVRALYRIFEDGRSDRDGIEARLIVGGVYKPTRTLRLQLTALVEREDAQIGAERSTAGGVQFRASYRYPAPFGAIDQEWTISGVASGVYRRFDDADPAVDPGGDRDQIDLRIGLEHRFQITRSVAVIADVEYRQRDASSPIYEFDAVTGGVAVAVRF